MGCGSSWGGRSSVAGWAGVGLPLLGLLALSLGLSAGMVGCGTPASPQPPSLKLPVPVSDLTAERAGEKLTLRWTTPRKTTDRLLIAGAVRVKVCRASAEATAKAASSYTTGTAGAESALGCAPAGESSVDPGKAAEFALMLPAELLAGEPRVARYFVELTNARGRSAGPSNVVAVLAGAAPGAVSGLAADVRADGVALRWQGDAAAVRLHRTLVSSPEKKPAKGGPLKPDAEPRERNLWVDAAASGKLEGSLDATARFGESYSYTAQHVARVMVDGQTLELGGLVSKAVRVDVVDRFPPGVPQDLAAVAAVEEKSIDLSWTPDTEADLAGYIVYRHDAMTDGGAWERISGAKPVVPAAWRDTTAVAGASYRYRVTAIDQSGHESAPSSEARESLPKGQE